MPRNYSAPFKRTINRTAAADIVLLLLEISHPDLGSPVRIVNDTQNLTSGGNLFVGMPFRASLPEDSDNGLPRAMLAIDNIGRDLVAWLETSGGGNGATVRIMQVRRSAPDTIEWEITMDLHGVSMNVMEVTGELGFEDILNRSAVALEYRPDVAPGLF